MPKDIESIADHFGMKHQMLKTVEECKEFIEAIEDLMRGDLTFEKYSHMLEEMGDVEVMISQVKYLYEVSELDLEFIKKEKIERTIQRYGVK